MKRTLLSLSLFLSVSLNAEAADLLSVYHDSVNNSPLLSNYLNTILAARQDVPINMGVVLPQVAATANASVNNFHASGVSANYTNTNYGLTATQQLFNYTDFANVAVANYTTKSAEATYVSQKQQFILNVAEAYFNVLTAQYDVQVAQTQYDFLKKTLDQTQAKFSVGLVTYTDVAQARANLDSANATLIQAQNALAISNENLRTYTGKEETNLAIIADPKTLPIDPPSPNDVNYWVKLSEAKNPLLLAQQATQSAALATVHANFGNQLPTLFVQASYQKNYYNNNVPAIVSSTTRTLQKTIELGLTWNIFSSGELMSQTLQAADEYVSQQNTSTNLYRQTASQTTQDFLSVLASIAQIQAYRQSEIAAEASLREFTAKYKVGTATIVDVLNEVQTLSQARFNLAQAMNQYIDSVLSLKTDVGQLSEQDLVRFNQYLQVPSSNQSTPQDTDLYSTG